jgi:dihydrofolate reductase
MSLVVYIAMSMDGYIADGAGSVDFLEPFSDALDGFAEFESSIGASILGRKTFEFMLEIDVESLAKRPHWVLTSRALPAVPPKIGATVRAAGGPMESILTDASGAAEGRDVWLVGGGRCLAGFLRAGLVDRMRLFVVPRILGGGTPLFAGDVGGPSTWQQTAVRRFGSGVVELCYERGASGPGRD